MSGIRTRRSTHRRTQTRNFQGYFPAIIFLFVSGLLLPFLFLVSGSGSRIAVEASVVIMVAITTSLILGVIVQEVRFYAFAIAFIGISLRASSVLFSKVSTDVLSTSAKATRLILSGRNPYEVMKAFPYPPLEPLFYLPFIGLDLRWIEFASSSIIVAMLLLTSLRSKNQPLATVYLALFSFSTLIIGFIGVATNDTSASLFPFAAIWLLMFSSSKHRYNLAGLLLGLGVAFKQFGIFPLIFVIGFLIKSKGPWLKTCIISASTVLIISLPFLIRNPMAFLFDVVMFHLTVRITSPYYVLASWVTTLLGPQLLILQLSLVIALAIFWLRRVKDWAECQFAWTSVFILSFVLGRYFAPSYFAYVMPFWIIAGLSSLGQVRLARERSS